MQKRFTLIVTGDSIINRRVSVHKEEEFTSLVNIIRNADVAYTHLETLIHDYDGPELYPAAEGPGVWMRSPSFVLDELKWMGFNLMSLASNHALDYSYGGLFATMKALEEAGLPYAGVGKNLGEAREPAYFDTEKGRVALISMCSTLLQWTRAGEVRRDIKGRPGVNPLRFYYVVDPKTIELLKELGFKFGWHVVQNDKTWLFTPPGLSNTVYKFVAGETSEVYQVADEADVEANLRSVRDARRQADYVLVHLHCHEWEAGKDIRTPPRFVQPFARACIDEGADVFIGQGSHTLRGIEIYKNKPIFYDPRDFINMVGTVAKLPADFYWSYTYEKYASKIRNWEATPADAHDTREAAMPLYASIAKFERVHGSIVAKCMFEDGKLVELKLYPIIHTPKPRYQSGRPKLADADQANKIIEYLRELSTPFDTKIEFKNGAGSVSLEV